MTIYTASQEIASDLKLKFTDDLRGMNDDTFGFIDIRATLLDSADVKGIPYPLEVNGHKTTTWLLPDFLPRDEKSKGIIFFDEINLSPPSIQAQLYQLINDRRIGNYYLPDGWFVIACGNRVTDRSNVFEMSSALSNRFCHFELSIPSISDWTNWATKHDIDSRVIAFNHYKEGSFLFKFDQTIKSKAFGTPRSWYFVSTLISGFHPKTEKEWDKLTALVSSAVGRGTGMEFTAFCKLNQKIDIDSILANPERIREIVEIDQLYSLISSLAERYKKEPKTLNSMLLIVKNMDTAELAVLLLHMVKNANPIAWDKNIKTLHNQLWNEIATKYSTYLLRVE
jgi:hypothetical protein